jgi:hypothetical protein
MWPVWFYRTFSTFITIIFLHGLGRLTCSGIDALPSFPGASAIPSSPGFVCEGVFRESGVVHFTFHIISQNGRFSEKMNQTQNMCFDILYNFCLKHFSF